MDDGRVELFFLCVASGSPAQHTADSVVVGCDQGASRAGVMKDMGKATEMGALTALGATLRKPRKCCVALRNPDPSKADRRLRRSNNSNAARISVQ